MPVRIASGVGRTIGFGLIIMFSAWVLQFLRITSGGTAWVDVPQAKEAEKVMSLEDKFFIYGQIGSVMAAKLAKIASEHYAKP